MIETIIAKLKEYRGALLLLRDTQLSIECERQGNIELLEIYAHKILDALFKGDDEGVLTDEEIQDIITNGYMKHSSLDVPKRRQVIDKDIAKAQKLFTSKLVAEEIFGEIGKQRGAGFVNEACFYITEKNWQLIKAHYGLNRGEEGE